LGGGDNPPIGTFSTYVIVARGQVIHTPAHLDDVHAAAWPVAGVTAWRYVLCAARAQLYPNVAQPHSHTCPRRAAIVNAHVTRGHNVLITGIGGGVALLAMQLCLALGARVYVTSGSDAKLARAVALGAAGGVNYTHGQSVHFRDCVRAGRSALTVKMTFLHR